MVVDPTERDARPAHARRPTIELARGAARRVLDARLRPDLRASTTSGPACSARSTGSSTAGAHRSGPTLGARPRDRPLRRRAASGAELVSSHARERGRRASTSTARAPCSSPRPCSSTRAATPTPTRRASRPSSPARSARRRSIWLPRGLTRDYEDFGTRGHVDMVATIPSPGTLLLHQQPNPEHPDFEVTRELRAFLAEQTDAAGRALRDHRPARARRPSATTRASSTGATSTTSS